MSEITLDPTWRTVPCIQGTWESEIISREPMLFSSSVEFANKNGGDLTKAVLRGIELECPDHFFVVIDTRSHMLMRGMYPAIPGWHCDGVMRGANGQPDFGLLDHKAEHRVITVSSEKGGVSNTEFIAEKLCVEYEPGKVWGSINDDIEESMSPDTYQVPDGDLITFNQLALHRATPAKTNGWRWFFRLSFYHSPPINKIRNQVQVYTSQSTGW